MHKLLMHPISTSQIPHGSPIADQTGFDKGHLPGINSLIVDPFFATPAQRDRLDAEFWFLRRLAEAAMLAGFRESPLDLMTEACRPARRGGPSVSN
ncbi:unnamed protein product [Protopolystoma xenopodis]|uniref:Uncharacterized protein n=1 Tax=Protopolystoma xenopodis TaxID=117903 RepID=A0A3S5ASE8_9PLAT|nr:unnamed protein product [Protopolystoma xenopodis]